jgi:hypothetical protein
MNEHTTPAHLLPPLTVVMTTWAPTGPDGYRRATNARMTLGTWQHRLVYEGPLYLHIADDGSALPDYPANIVEYPGNFLETTYSRQERHGVGASLNAGFRQAHDLRGGLVLYAVDDWLLLEQFDVSPWARLLVERSEVGMVRLGPPHPDLTGRIEALTAEWQGWGLRLDRHHYAFGHRPALYHQRMRDAYGPFAEDVNAYECERLYAERWARGFLTEPGIVLALPHPWLHVDGPEFAGIEPAGAVGAGLGHGWVRPRPDGAMARCGGPAICSLCKAEAEALR